MTLESKTAALAERAKRLRVEAHGTGDYFKREYLLDEAAELALRAYRAERLLREAESAVVEAELCMQCDSTHCTDSSGADKHNARARELRAQAAALVDDASE